MKSFNQLLLVAALALIPASAPAQGVIGGNQNGFGPGGYLPKPPAFAPAPGVTGQLVNSLAMPGYDFKLIEISGQPVKLVIDSSPFVVPLANPARTRASTNTVGFLATFVLDNNNCRRGPDV